MKCEYCNHKLDALSTNCRYCGAPIPAHIQHKLRKKHTAPKEDHLSLIALYILFVCIFLILFGLISGKTL